MLSKIKEHIKKYKLKEGDFVLLACSGGIDSMVLFDIFKKTQSGQITSQDGTIFDKLV